MEAELKSTQQTYRTSDFARRAGVTVRTLHHYDRLGLLKPAGRTSGGYRVYTDRDLVRLEQIVALKFVGFSLNQIADILNRHPQDLATALRAQRQIMAEKRRLVDSAIAAIELAERAAGSSQSAESEAVLDALTHIIEVIEMQQNMDWTNKYYTPEAKAKLAERYDPELARQGEQQWAALIAEVEQAVRENVDPAGDRAQKLAQRWSELIRAFTGGDPQIQNGLNKMYADQQNWPATVKKPFSDEVGHFICAAQAAGKK
jgi:DNA-binding transcriptional MerR regulator